MVKGDILLITFPFADLTGNKLRPAIVLFENGSDLTVCFITSQIRWSEPTDIALSSTIGNGLRKSSLIRTSKIATLDKSLAKGLLGRISELQIKELNKNLVALFKL